MTENLTGMIHNDLHKYLIGMHEVDDKLPQCQDVEEKWESIAQSYLPDGIRDFTAYPTTSLGWMMYIGMAVAKFWDEEWEIYGNIEDLYSYMRDKRGFRRNSTASSTNIQISSAIRW